MCWIYFLSVLCAKIIPFVTSDIIASRFARDYFYDRTIRQVVIFACWNSDERVEFSRALMQSDTKISYFDANDDFVMEKILKVDYYKLGIFVDFDCSNSESIFQQFSDERMRYNESYWWLIVTNLKSVPESFFGRLPLNIATEMTVAIRRDDDYEFFDVYNPSHRHGANLNVTFMGHWNIQDGLNVELTQYKYKRRGNLHGLVLNLSIAIDHPPKNDFENFLTKPIDKHFDTMHRFNYALLLQLRDFYNFTINLMRGTTWGYKVNGTYNGILGDMVKGIVDISATPFNYKMDRLDVIEFTVQTWIIEVVLIFRHPKKNDLKNVFLSPFTFDVWGLIVVVGIVNWILLYAIVKIQQRYDWTKPTNTLDTHPASETGLIAVASICQQGLSDGPRIYSGRIVFLFLFLWGLLMFQFYSASLVRSLLVENPRFIKTPEDVLHSNLDVGAEDIAYNRDYFETSDNPVTRQIFDKKMSINKKRTKLPYYKAEEGLKKVQQGGFALHIDTATAYKFIEETFEEEEICELAEIHLLAPRHTSTGVSRHSPFKKMVTYGLRLIMERGTSKRLRNVWNHRRPQCPESHSSTPVPVMIQEFSPALFLLMFGCGLSIIIMLLEKTISYGLENRRISNDDTSRSTTANKIGLADQSVEFNPE